MKKLKSRFLENRLNFLNPFRVWNPERVKKKTRLFQDGFLNLSISIGIIDQT